MLLLGAPAVDEHGEVHAASAAWGGLELCGSAWECPVCAYHVRTNHARELVRVAQAHRATGGHVYLVTLTFAHGWGDDLGKLRKGAANAWRATIRGAGWTRWKREAGLVGFARALEVTHGAHGWHPHLHALMFTEHEVPRRLAQKLAERWRKGILDELPPRHAPDVWTEVKAGARVVYSTPGCRVETTRDGDTAARYLAKLGLEVSGVGKRGRSTQWSLLSDAVEEDPRATWLWMDYAEAMRGARSLTWSRTLRERYNIAFEDDPRPRGRVAVVLDRRSWFLVREREWEVLEIGRKEGAKGVLRWIRARDPCAASEAARLSFLASGDHTLLAL